jgi:putative ABC transport system permease protein
MKESPGEVKFFLNYAVVKLGKYNQKETISFIENKWHEFEDYRPFEYSYLDQELAGLYREETNLSVLSLVFAFVIVLISLMGLFGLASYTTERRTKEVGIRKVFGALEKDIVVLLTTDFLRLVLISSILAWPVAYLVGIEWLQNFAYREAISIWPFILAVLGAVIVALLTVSYKSIRAARSNPVDALRYE